MRRPTCPTVPRALPLLLVALLAGCRTRPTAASDLWSDLAAIHSLGERYGAAFARGDVEEALSLYTFDHAALPPGSPRPFDRRELRDRIATELRTSPIRALRITHENILVTDRWAWVRGRSEATIADGPEEHVARRGDYFWLLRRLTDGGWRIVCDCAAGTSATEIQPSICAVTARSAP